MWHAVSPHMPCPDCGASIEQTKADKHVCDEERKLRYKEFQKEKGLTGKKEGLMTRRSGRYLSGDDILGMAIAIVAILGIVVYVVIDYIHSI